MGDRKRSREIMGEKKERKWKMRGVGLAKKNSPILPRLKQGKRNQVLG